jgi:hypothetical protein
MTAISGGRTSTGNLARQLEEGINSIANQEYPELSKEYADILDVTSSKKNYETDVPMAGTGFAKVKPEGNGIEYDAMQEGASKRYKHTSYALGMIITEEAIEDNLYLPMMAKGAKMLARSVNHTKEQVAANMFNNAYNAAYTGWDGQSLFSNQHKLIKGGTFSNVLPVAADLSEAALEDALIAVEELTDDAGLILGIKAQSLHIPTAQQFNAERILKSTLQNDTDNNAVNAMKNMGLLPKGYYVNHRFDDPNNWFIRTNVEDGGKMFMRKDFETKSDNDFGTGNYKHKATTRFSIGWTDSRQYFGSGEIV